MVTRVLGLDYMKRRNGYGLEANRGIRLTVVEALSIPKLLADVVELRLRHESVSREEVHALWLGAGLATHVGLAIFEEPERFVIAHELAPLAA